MSKKRIHYQNWIAESGINPDNLKNKSGAASDFLSELSLISVDCIPELLNSYRMKEKSYTELQLLIQLTVQDALGNLPEKEIFCREIWRDRFIPADLPELPAKDYDRVQTAGK